MLLGESVVNDAAAIVIYRAALDFAQDDREATQLCTHQMPAVPVSWYRSGRGGALHAGELTAGSATLLVLELTW